MAILLGSLTPFLAIPVFMILMEKRFILTEEAMLEKQFGPAYLKYKKDVHRWL